MEYTSLHPLQLFRSLTLGSYCGFLFVCYVLFNVETEKKSIPNVFYFPTFFSDNRILTDSWSPEPSPDRKTWFIDFNIADKWNRISELQIKFFTFGYPWNKIINVDLTHGHPLLPTSSDRTRAAECSNFELQTSDRFQELAFRRKGFLDPLPVTGGGLENSSVTW